MPFHPTQNVLQLSGIDTEGGVVDLSNLLFQVLPGNDEAF